MKFRQILPFVIAAVMMGAPGAGHADAGTPISAIPEKAPAAEAAPAEARPWETVIVSDAAERNEKTAYYRRLPEGEKRIGNGRLVAYFPGTLPRGITEELRYDRYPVPREYLMHMRGGAVAVKAEPRFRAATVRTAGRYQPLETDGIVLGEYGAQEDSRHWYRVRWGTPEDRREGYVFAPHITRRGFQFHKMAGFINRLRDTLDAGQAAHIDNYKNRNGWAPARQGQNQDAFGVLRDQSAPAYYQPDTAGDFRYLTDGSLVTLLGEQGDYYEANVVDFDGVYFIPKKYIPAEPRMQRLEKVVVVDRGHQNEAVFERFGDGWKLISYVLATTGENAPFKQETSLGHYMAIEKKSRFLYLGDISKEIEGYAPYALRFDGGAYIHGVPVNFREIRSKVVVQPEVLDPLGNIVAPAVTRDVVVGREDPGMQEYLSSIGTVPRSHKCVRNYTSHAKFLYDWAEIGKTAVIVIE